MNHTDKAKDNQYPLVSVIVISMNRKDILKKCLESVRCQHFTDVEMIVVDNASSDGTGDMVQSLFPEIRYFYLHENSGVPGGRNYGARMATGDICVFIDDDAVFCDNHALEKTVAYFDGDHRLGCLAFRILQPSDRNEEYKSIPRADKKIISEDYESAYFCGAGFAVRRNVILEIGMFWEALFFIGEELDLSYRLMEKGFKIIRSAGISVIHYEIPQGRIQGQWIYYGVRNRFWMAVKNLPVPNIFSYAILWWTYFLFLAFKDRHPLFFLKGMKDALAGLPEVLKQRRCISGKTIEALKKLSGRIYY